MSSKQIISKEKYLALMERQREHLGRLVDSAKEDLDTFEFGLEHQLQTDFDEVEVTQNDGAISFKIVEKTND